jgi:AraC-like DNA-binding protein
LEAAAMQTLAERRVRRLSDTSYALQVRDFLLRQSSPRRVAMNTVARALGLSPRSLRRRLAVQGESYGAVRDAALAAMAKQLLGEQQLSIKETAHEMGFASTGTFHRAFKHWTGTTPSAYGARIANRAEQGIGAH